ncbi:MAG: hypothetical protein GX130_02295 [Candidatus Hydrogenedens sp.]|jgi:hypothetical protein|nr:hypothetical protein [Candidatus Hydrogenedens sp.]
MKNMLSLALVSLLVLVLLSGCIWIENTPPQDPVEGEEILEGETPEGESPSEGEALAEGELLAEGESSEGEVPEGETETPLFTSADPMQQSRNDYLLHEEAMPDAGSDDDLGKDSRELVEPDVIRRAGNLLYILNQYRGLTIVDLANQELISQTPTFGYPRDLYLNGNTAYVLVSYAQDVQLDEDGRYQVSYGSRLYVFDVTDPEAVFSRGTHSFQGDLIDSRQVGSILYAVCTNYTWYYAKDSDTAINTETTEKSYGDTWAISLDIHDPENITLADEIQFEGFGNLIQATSEAIFCASGDWYHDSTTITCVDISDPQGRLLNHGTVTVKGHLADRFKMDAWEGHLRVVSNTGWSDRRTLVTTVKLETLEVLAQIELDSAAGDTTYATRFDGPRVYIVTYFNVDPLYVVDLKDPANPRELGELEVPGWSTHIEVRGDRLIALGVDDTGGKRKVMVSLFDVGDPESLERKGFISFGDDWSWSTAYEDVKAFAILDNMILVPFSGWNQGSGGYDRVQFISFTDDTLQAHGHVDLQGSAIRSLFHEGLYFTVTQEQLAVIDADNPDRPEILNSLALAENLVDAVPLQDGWLVEVVSRYDSADTILQAIHADGSVGTEVTLKVPSITDTFLWNDKLAVVASGYGYYPDYRSFYDVFLVDFSDPAEPVLEKEIPLKLDPWYSYWWMSYDYHYAEPAVEKMARPGIYYPYYYQDDSPTALLAGDHLVLRGLSEDFDSYLGGTSAHQGLVLIDLADPDSVHYLGLADPDLREVNSDGKLLYLTTRKSLGTDSGQRSVCAYYLSTLDPASMIIGKPVNVPGLFQHRVPKSNIIVLKDTQYRQDDSIKEMLRCGILGRDIFSLQDSINLPFYNTQIAASHNFVTYVGYASSYNGGVIADTLQPSDALISARYENGYVLGAVFINDKGGFSFHETQNVGEVWCTLLGAREGSAFLSVAGAAAAQWDFNDSPPEQMKLLPVMGYPGKMRFGEDTALLTLGYGGIATFPL